MSFLNDLIERGMAAGWLSRRMLTAGVMVGLLLLLGVGLLLVVRRWNGAFTNDLSVPALLGAVATVMASIGAVRAAWRTLHPLHAQQHQTTWADQVVGWGTSLAFVLWANGCSFPYSRIFDSLVWIPLFIADQFWRQNFFDSGNPEYQAGPVPDQASSESYFASTVQLADGADGAAEAFPAEDCLQRVFRVREENGQEAIYATVVAEFQANQRNATVHVGFCPPLEYLPEIEAEPCSGPPCQVKIVQAFAHGARIDLRLNSPSEEPFQLALDMAARPPAAASA